MGVKQLYYEKCAGWMITRTCYSKFLQETVLNKWKATIYFYIETRLLQKRVDCI